MSHPKKVSSVQQVCASSMSRRPKAAESTVQAEGDGAGKRPMSGSRSKSAEPIAVLVFECSLNKAVGGTSYQK